MGLLILGSSALYAAMAMPDAARVPRAFCCAITQDLMRDPVVTVDGSVFERAALVEWFRRGHRTNPVTNLPLPSIRS